MSVIKVPVMVWVLASCASGLFFLYAAICANGWWNTRHATLPGDMLAHQLSAELGGLSLSAFAILLLFVVLSEPEPR